MEKIETYKTEWLVCGHAHYKHNIPSFLPFFPTMDYLNSHIAKHGLDIQKITGDGNCFYRALAAALIGDDEQHMIMRGTIMDYMAQHVGDYGMYFENPKTYKRCVAANRNSGVWNTEICDLVPSAAAAALKIKLVIHSFDLSKRVVVVETYEHMGGAQIDLMLLCGHYSLLTPSASGPGAAAIAAAAPAPAPKQPMAIAH